MKFEYPRPQGYDLELAFATRVLGLESLHYGLWTKGQSLTLANLKQAQRRYTQKLLSHIPSSTRTVLDVGCGIGDNALAMAKKNLKITSLSPDPNHAIAFTPITKDYPHIRFVQSRYQDYQSDAGYDLVLMSESSNYFPQELGLDKTVSVVRPGGHLLISGMFRRRPSPEYEEMHVLSDFIHSARDRGLILVRDTDITSRVLPTLSLASGHYQQYVLPAAQVVQEYYRLAFPLKFKFLTLFFGHEISLLSRALNQAIPDRLNTRKFTKHVRYMILLFCFHSPWS